MVRAPVARAQAADVAVPDLITRAAQDLETQGWAVVPDVLTAAECTEYVDGAWSWLTSLETGIDRSNPNSWDDDRWPSSFRGIINTLEISHQDFVWRVRQNPKVLQVADNMCSYQQPHKLLIHSVSYQPCKQHCVLLTFCNTLMSTTT